MYRSYNAADEITARSRGNFHSNFRPGIDAECRMIKVENGGGEEPPLIFAVDRRLAGENRWERGSNDPLDRARTIGKGRRVSLREMVKIRQRVHGTVDRGQLALYSRAILVDLSEIGDEIVFSKISRSNQSPFSLSLFLSVPLFPVQWKTTC